MARTAQFLIVSSRGARAHSIARRYRPYGTVRVLPGVVAAAKATTQLSYTGVVLDRTLPDGDGLEFLARLRALSPLRQDLLSLPAVGPVAVLGALQAGVPPITFRSHAHFALHAIAAEHVCPAAALRVAASAAEHTLTALQTRIMALEAAHVPRSEWPTILGCPSSRTIRRHVANLCERTGVRVLRDLTDPIARAILHAKAHENWMRTFSGDGALDTSPR